MCLGGVYLERRAKDGGVGVCILKGVLHIHKGGGDWTVSNEREGGLDPRVKVGVVEEVVIGWRNEWIGWEGQFKTD